MSHPPAPDEVVISDPRTLRALAHPARITVLHHLFAGEVLTATEFAQIAGLTPSAMSYHLRALEKWGLIGRAEPAGDGRERPWRSIGRSIRIDPYASDAAHAAKGQVLGSLVDLLRADLTTALGPHAPDRQPATDPTATKVDATPMGFTVVPLTLTDDEAQQVMAHLGELLEQRPRQDQSPEGARRYHAYWALLPLDRRATT